MDKIGVIIIISLFLLGCIDNEKQKNQDDAPIIVSGVKDKLRNNAYSTVGIPCGEDFDCDLPAKFAILSHCPYSMRCMDSKCVVVCPLSEFDTNGKPYPVRCETKSDCNCEGLVTVGLKECACQNNHCMVISARTGADTDFE